MVAIDDGVAVGKVRCVAIIHKNAAVFIIRAINLPGQIVVVVPMLQHGIVYHRIRQIEPRRHILVLLAQLVKIHLKVLLGLARFADGVLPDDLLVKTCAGILLRVIAVDLVA